MLAESLIVVNELGRVSAMRKRPTVRPHWGGSHQRDATDAWTPDRLEAVFALLQTEFNRSPGAGGITSHHAEFGACCAGVRGFHPRRVRADARRNRAGQGRTGGVLPAYLPPGCAEAGRSGLCCYRLRRRSWHGRAMVRRSKWLSAHRAAEDVDLPMRSCNFVEGMVTGADALGGARGRRSSR
jgi:hypothetical protein